MSIELQFGLSKEVPANAEAAWGARWIYPDDQLPDRQGFHNWGTEAGTRLRAWLNGGALGKARTEAARLAKHYLMDQKTCEVFVLYQDAQGKIVGSPNASYGYVYVAAFLKS